MARDTLIRLQPATRLTKDRVYHVIRVNSDGEFVIIDDRGIEYKVGNGAIANGFWAWEEEKTVMIPNSVYLRAKEIVDGVV